MFNPLMARLRLLFYLETLDHSIIPWLAPSLLYHRMPERKNPSVCRSNQTQDSKHHKRTLYPLHHGPSVTRVGYYELTWLFNFANDSRSRTWAVRVDEIDAEVEVKVTEERAGHDTSWVAANGRKDPLALAQGYSTSIVAFPEPGVLGNTALLFAVQGTIIKSKDNGRPHSLLYFLSEKQSLTEKELSQGSSAARCNYLTLDPRKRATNLKDVSPIQVWPKKRVPNCE